MVVPTANAFVDVQENAVLATIFPRTLRRWTTGHREQVRRAEKPPWTAWRKLL